MATLILTDDQRQTLERLLRDGLTHRAIARRLNLSPYYVGRYARRLGLSAPKRQPSPNLLKAIALVRDHGWSYKQAAVACNISFSTVRHGCLRRQITSAYPRYGTKQAIADARHRAITPQPAVEITP